MADDRGGVVLCDAGVDVGAPVSGAVLPTDEERVQPEGLGASSGLGSREPSPSVSALTGFDPSRDTPLRREVIAVINEMSRFMPNATEDWRARLTEALL